MADEGGRLFTRSRRCYSYEACGSIGIASMLWVGEHLLTEA